MAYQKAFHTGGNRHRPGVRTFRPGKRPAAGNKRGAYIHPSKFVNQAVTAVEEVVYEPTHTFADFPFSEALKKNIAAKGYETPSAIQDQAIPLVLEGKDVIGLANTGTGKTAAFTLPFVDKLRGTDARMAMLIMAPTRELAQQIDVEFKSFTSGMNLYSAICVGGMNIDRQIRDLRRRPHVIIGTPGRLKDLIKRRELNLDNIHVLVLDEADRMLDMGFIGDIREIVRQTPEDRQTLFFSATINPTVEVVVQEFLKDPTTISVKTSETNDHIEQDVIEFTSKEHKIELLTSMLSKEEFEKVLVFGETKYGVQRLADNLTKAGIPSAAIHGNKSQSQRQRALNEFKNHQVKVLVATDVAARGLDIPNVSHVINFDQPATYQDYVHRIGRTGRAGARGRAYTFVAPR